MDPIEYIDGQWYFWDETFSHTYGPYETEYDARNAHSNYVFDEKQW